ncbi:uncharacterized protein PG998_004832 [Apiospora kogelbergensis]|uniref:uncharacterized protein n=1 Tax=Apiospora kogelbergensis TaxID=1337665 RepID=UPI0031308E1D
MAPQKGSQAIKQKHQSNNHHAAVAPTAANGANPTPVVVGTGGVNGAYSGPSQSQPPNKKQLLTAARPAVVPALPLHYLNRQPSRQHQQKPQQQHRGSSNNHSHHQRRPSTNGAPAANSANGHPASSLEAALIDHHAAAPDPTLALQKAAHRKNMSASGNEAATNGAGVEKAGGVETTAHAAHSNTNRNNASTTANGATNGAVPRGHENNNGHKKGSRGRNNSVINGAKHQTQTSTQNGRGDAKQHKRNQSSSHSNGPVSGIGNITFGDVPNAIHAPDTPARTRSSSLVAQASVAPVAANDPERTPLALSNGSAPHHPQQHQGTCFFVSCIPLPIHVRLENICLPFLSLTAAYHQSELSSPTSGFDSQPPSATRPVTDSMPHAQPKGHHFHDAQHRLGIDHGSDPTGFHPAHQMRSLPGPNGAIMFGGMGFPDSHSPSPIPPNSASFMPPPSGPHGNGHHLNGANGGENGQGFPSINGFHGHGHAHTDSSATNFPGHPAPFRHEMGPLATTMDSYGQVQAPAPVPHGPYDGYPPNMGRYGPPTPHSFQGSQASGDQNGADNGQHFLPPNAHGYGNHGHHPSHPPGLPHAMSHGHFQPFMGPGHFSGRPGMMAEDLADSVAYIRSQFDSSELSDCVLELVFNNRREENVQIKGHKLILARSPCLKNYIMLLRAQDPGSHTLSIQSEDMWLRPDAWYMAVQRLYLGALLPIPPPMGGSISTSEQAQRHADQFNFALAYAAAGNLLQMQDVLVRGLQIAADMINWNNVEEGLAFALDSTHQRYSDDDSDVPDVDYNYGRESELLISAMVNFLINAFPANFELDTSVLDPSAFARLPAVPKPTHYQKSAPAIARGSSIRQPTKAKPTRLSSIKFGDLPTAYPEEDGASPREPAKCSPQLSRILLNLPFHTLRYVLTSESNGVSGWNTAQDRYHAVADVVAEREARRLRAVEAVRGGNIPGAEQIQRRLSSPQRHTIIDAWDSLNWQEEVVQPSGAGVPRLVCRWVPQFAVPPMVETEEPQTYEPHPYESMV